MGFKIVFSYFQIKFFENSGVNSTLNKHNYLHLIGLEVVFMDKNIQEKAK